MLDVAIVLYQCHAIKHRGMLRSVGEISLSTPQLSRKRRGVARMLYIITCRYSVRSGKQQNRSLHGGYRLCEEEHLGRLT